MIGWISLHRQIQEHWIWNNPVFLQRWLYMLFRANHTDGEMVIGYDRYTIKRGQCAYSLRKWANLFECGTKQVTKFFKLLEDDNMIKKETIGKGKKSTTMVTIVNYECYQTNQSEQDGNASEHASEHTKETQEKRKRNARGTQYNNGNNGNNENNENNSHSSDATRRKREKKKPDIEVLLDKIIERYPGSINARGPMLKALKQLDTEERKLALKNVDRYTEAWEGYHHNLRNYLESKQFSEKELSKRETKNSTNHTTNKELVGQKTFKADYGDI